MKRVPGVVIVYNQEWLGSPDVAIVKLQSPLVFNSNVQPACLPDFDFSPDKKAQDDFK